MYNSIKKLVICTMMLLLVISFWGCGNEEISSESLDYNNGEIMQGEKNTESISSVALVAGNREHAPLSNFDKYKEVITDVCYNQGQVVLIENDGDPYVVSELKIPKSKSGISESKRKSIAETQANEICQYAKTIEPKTSEADPLKGLILASKMLENYEGNKHIIIQDNFIGTTGILDMSTAILSMDIGTTVEYLKDNNCIPNLRDTKVTWIGLGETIGEKQKKLSEKDFAIMKSLCKEILMAGGAEESDISFKTLGEYEINEKNWPTVKTVSFPDSTILFEDDVAFKKNSSEFVNEEDALKKISLISSTYNCNDNVLVVGFASSEGDERINRELSEKRAQRVADLLTREGLNAKSIGMGYDKKYCITDTNPDGTLIESKAMLNRKIIILNEDSNMAREIVEK